MSQGCASEAQLEIPIDPALLAEQTQAQLEQQDEGAVHDALLEPVLEYAAPDPYDYDPAAHLLAQPPEQAVASSSKQTLPPPIPVTASKPPRSRKQRPPQHTVVVREDTCSFCQGGDAANKRGEAEDMVSCVRCGRSGHPSCLNMVSSKLIAKIKTYPWVCLECKTCEVCDSKGEDSRLMFCDGCDRGWHSYCLDPPLAKPPKGHWICPVCRHSKVPRPKPDAARAIPSESSVAPEIPFIQTPTIRKIKPVRSRASELAIETPRVRKSTPKVRLESPVAAVTPETSRKKRPKEKSGIVVRLRVPSGGGNRVQEVQEEEEEQVPFGGIIQGADADTMRTSIKDADREAFEKSRKAAEAKLGGPPPPTWDPLASLPATPGGSPRASPIPSSASFSSLPTATPNRSLRDRLLLHQTATPTTTDSGFPFPPSNPGASEKIKTIRFGIYDIDTWYAAPYPEEYAAVPDGRLWLCEFCLKYMKSGFVAGRHRMKCKARHPPGDEIYRDGKVSVFEVDGRKNKIYCQNLCLLAKMFLDHKTLYYDVEPFLFYVMTEVDEVGARFVGYFSKEKRSPDYNVSCIMTLPVRQRKGWGHLLIDFSYLLSRKEGRVGSPEKPLSALGALSYRNYWTVTVFDYLRTARKGIKMDDISAKTSMTLEDIHSVLTERGLLKLLNPPEETLAIALPQRRNGISRRQTSPRKPAAKAVIPLPSEYTIEWDPAEIEAYMVRFEQKEYLRLVPERLKYTPFLVTRNQPGVPPTLVPVVPVGPRDEDADAEGEEAQEVQVQDHTQEEQEQVEYKEEPPIPNGHTNGHTNGASIELEPQADDEATLRVAALSSPTRSLKKKRALSPAVDDEPPRKRTRSSLPRAPATPKRFTRTPTNPYPPRSRRSAGGNTPVLQQVTPTKSNGIKQLEEEWGDEDAEGEEWIE